MCVKGYRKGTLETVNTISERLVLSESENKLLMNSFYRDHLSLPEDIIYYLIDNENRPVITSIKMNGRGKVDNKKINTNVLTSFYGKDHYNDFVKNNIKYSNLLYDKHQGIIKELDIGDRVQFPMIEPSKEITSDNPKTATQSSDKFVS